MNRHLPPVADKMPAAAGPHGDGILLGSGPVIVDAYVDFQSPACAEFEAAVGSTLDRMVADGEISLIYHPVAMLDAWSTNRFSSRASSASGCASDGGRFREYARALYPHQPPEGGTGPTDEDLVGIGASVGLTDPRFGDCVRSEAYEEWTIWVTVQAGDRLINWLPSVRVDEMPVAPNVSAIRSAVAGHGSPAF